MASTLEAPTRPSGLRIAAHWLWKELRVALAISLGAALFVWVIFDNAFVDVLVFSLCISFAIQALVEAGRHGLTRLRQRFSLPAPQRLGDDRPWPGWAWMGPWILMSSVVGFVAGSWLAEVLLDLPHTHGPLAGNPRSLFLLLAMCVSIAGVTTYYHAMRGKVAAIEARAQAAQRAAAENQLRLLQSQLEPHMLFNTLANLRVLVASDPARAQAMLDRLISFLRSTLTASRSATHALADEFARVDDYLALMQVRMGPRLAVRLDLPRELAALPVPPLLLQPLVENAIKHGLEPQVAGGRIDISARREGDRLVLEVRDDGVGAAAPAPAPTPDGQGTGFGLLQVRERLAATFGGRARLSLQAAADGRGMRAAVELPLDTAVDMAVDGQHAALHHPGP
jgi:hypothetical protein